MRMKKKFNKYLKHFYPFLILLPFVFLAIFFAMRVIVGEVEVSLFQSTPFPPGAQYADNQIIVKFKEDQSPGALEGKEKKELDEALFIIGVLSYSKLFNDQAGILSNYYLLRLKPESDIKEIYKLLDRISQVDSVTPDYILFTQDIPNDPYFLEHQWGMKKINLENAWSMWQTRNREVTVAVIDTGVDYTQPDLIGKVIKGRNEVNNSMDPMDDHAGGHGTHVAGIIAAVTNNNIGVAGTTWGAKVLAIKACDSNGSCLTSNVIKGIEYALQRGVKIINLSIAAPGDCGRQSIFNPSRVYDDVMKEVKRRGALLVVAAGNDNMDASLEIPGACDGAFTVGATNPENGRWVGVSKQSNFGTRINIAAPGQDILSTGRNNSYILKSGTSMAAPHVSGIVALIYSFNKGKTMEQIKNCILQSADPITTDKPIGKLINAEKALIQCGALPKVTPTRIPTPTDTVLPFSISGTTYVDQDSDKQRDSGERTIGGVQVILSGGGSSSVVSNSLGKYVFSNLSSTDYTVTYTIGGRSVDAIFDVTLTPASAFAVINLPVPGNFVPTPTLNLTRTPTPPRRSSKCYIDPECLSNKKSVQVCSFKCE